MAQEHPLPGTFTGARSASLFWRPGLPGKHRNGFSEEELQTAIEQAKRDFDPSSPGKGRVQDWSRGVPSRNRQGVVDELDGISTSAPTTHPKR